MVSTACRLLGSRFPLGDGFFLAREDFLEAACFRVTFFLGAVFLATAFRLVVFFFFGMVVSLPSIFRYECLGVEL